jgi:hypothetical protein
VSYHSDILFRKLILIPYSLATKSNLKEIDSSYVLPIWLIVLLERDKHVPYFSYSLKQVQIWAQEYASLSGSPANLNDWQCRIMEKNALMKKVLI